MTNENRVGQTCAIIIVKWTNDNETIYGPFETEADAMDWASEYTSGSLFQIRPVFGEARYTE